MPFSFQKSRSEVKSHKTLNTPSLSESNSIVNTHGLLNNSTYSGRNYLDFNVNFKVTKVIEKFQVLNTAKTLWESLKTDTETVIVAVVLVVAFFGAMGCCFYFAIRFACCCKKP